MKAISGIVLVGLCVGLMGCGSRSTTLEEAAKSHQYNLSWSAGSANLDNDKEFTTLPVKVTAHGDQFYMEYPYYDGKITGTLNGKELKANWTQEGPGDRHFAGEFYMKFNDDFSRGEGWWKDPGDVPKHSAILAWR